MSGKRDKQRRRERMDPAEMFAELRKDPALFDEFGKRFNEYINDLPVGGFEMIDWQNQTVVCALDEDFNHPMFPDNLRGHCYICFRGVQYRPFNQRVGRKVCNECAAPFLKEFFEKRRQGAPRKDLS